MKHIFFLLVVTNICFGQQNVIDLQLDSLTSNLHDVIDLQRSIEIEEIEGVYRLTPWHFVPSPALNYDFINERYYFTVSLNSGPVISYFISKRQEQRRLSAIKRRYDNQIKSNEIRLRSLVLSVNQRIVNLQLSHEIVSNDIEIFLIKSTEHANNEIDTETFLKEKSAILNKIKNHNSDVSTIQKELLEIELLTETEINIDLSHFLFLPAKILRDEYR